MNDIKIMTKKQLRTIARWNNFSVGSYFTSIIRKIVDTYNVRVE